MAMRVRELLEGKARRWAIGLSGSMRAKCPNADPVAALEAWTHGARAISGTLVDPENAEEIS